MVRKSLLDSRWIAILVTITVLALGLFWRIEKRFDCVETALAKIECILNVELMQMAGMKGENENQTKARGDKKIFRP